MRNCQLTFLCAILISGSIFGQNNPWNNKAESAIAMQAGTRDIIPEHYRTLHLDVSLFKSWLSTAPSEQDFVAGKPGIQIDFPLPYAGSSTFEVWEAPVMHPDLSTRYPDIRSYAGRNRAGDYLRFSVSPLGLRAMVLPVDRRNKYSVTPYFRDGVEDYICYAQKDAKLPEDQMFEFLSDETESEVESQPAASDRAGSCGNLRKYRLALACTVEYAIWKGGTGPVPDKTLVLAAMNALLTGVNAIYETDAGIRMEMVANNDLIMYTVPADGDPYTYGSPSAMLAENQTTCDNVIGAANYDIGHVLGRSPGGAGASFSVVCGGWKARGVTNSTNTFYDDIWVEFMTAMSANQFGASNTHYWPCGGGVGIEPGGGSTLRGTTMYNNCNPSMQDYPDPYFHAYSIAQILGYANGNGNCAELVPNGNSAPTCNALVNKNIPKSTPFVLTVTGAADSDPNDVLSYCWEQMDLKVSPIQTMPPTPTNKNGPVFRSLPPSTSPSRYFPNFADVLNNTNGLYEVLPSVSRDLNFRVTIRDNHAGGGCTTEKDIKVTVKSQAGPFVVTQPNTGVNWLGNSSQTITWNVAGTTGNQINCANVAILLSTDGGATFSTLLASTPNDGSQAVTIPNTPTTEARIMVQSVGNIFYDVSNVNFTITAAPLPFGGIQHSSDASLLVYPNPSSSLIQIQVPSKWQDRPLLLRIWDTAGRMVLENPAFNSGDTVNLISLEKGTYQIEVTLNNEKLFGGFVRQ